MGSSAQRDNVAITDEQVQFFDENGYLIVKDVLDRAELKELHAGSDLLVREGNPEDPQLDYQYLPGTVTGNITLKRIDYVVDKALAFRVLMGHPRILRTVEALTSADLIPTWDAMVFKMPYEGILKAWHRDAAVDFAYDVPIFNVDFYLDESDKDTALWAIPGSHRWSHERAADYLGAETFEFPEAKPLYMQPGDVLFHEIRLLHASPLNTSPNLRRVIYYEFRTAHVEIEHGPHTPEYIPLKQDLLRCCIELRKDADYIPDDEVPYVYAPPAPFNEFEDLPPGGLATYRHDHEDFWRG